MATWEDGPEYAPVERPTAFAEPAVGIGLESPPPPPPAPEPPTEQPVFDGPAQAGPPLAALMQEPPAVRDPQQPFAVASSVMTAESSAWASAHWAAPQASAPPPAGPQSPITVSPSLRPNAAASSFTQPAAQPVGRPQPGDGAAAPGLNHAPGYPPTSGPTGFPPPTGAPAYPPPTGTPAYPPPPPSPYATFPTSAPFPPPGGPPAPGPFPAPGTTEWFAPGAYQQPPPPPTTPDARAVLTAATPGVLVTLLVGAFIWVLAPVTLVIAVLLAGRMTYARKATRTAFAAVLSFLGLVGLVSVFTSDGLFADWWDVVARWACFGSWVMLGMVAVLVYRALKQGRPDPPPSPRGTLR